ncbi:beta-glucosidase BoGH3B-like [Telopea speciosissima]|uniref:beta-glucosidase BoGH3B-like n=1 Tax=Telopea speciosissima TaxID=54955 RepID=UPI001CC6B047|nr:beta-glucosidase BoGH3B-like [Telopea speciosissima]
MWADMIDGFQKSALSARLGIPMIYGTDAIHGHNNVLGATIFPHNIGLGAARDEDLMVKIGSTTALEVQGTGMPYAFAPCIAVCRDPWWGRRYESYSEDTQIVRSMSKIILGLQGYPPHNHTIGYPFVTSGGRKVLACTKHYAGDGGTQGGVDEYNTVTTYADLYRIHMTPYIDAIAMGGMVISDWEAIDRMTNPPGSHYKESLKAAINAGIDMVMIPYKYQQYLTYMTELVSSGEIPISRIDDAKHRELAREAVRKSLVLLKIGKGEEKMLPLSKNAPKILVVGSHAHNIGYQCGGWTVSWKGTSGNITKGTTILEGIKRAVSKQTQVVFQEKPGKQFVNKNQDSSYAIVVVGRPVVIEPYVDMMEALMAAWLPGSEAGKGIADVIFGDYDFQGKLPKTWFRRVDQLPMNFGDPYYDPLYPFGYGLQMGIQSHKRGSATSFSSI